MSSTRVDLPLPDTPVTQVKQPIGNDAVTAFRLFSAAPVIVSHPSPAGPAFGATRARGMAIRARPER